MAGKPSPLYPQKKKLRHGQRNTGRWQHAVTKGRDNDHLPLTLLRVIFTARGFLQTMCSGDLKRSYEAGGGNRPPEATYQWTRPLFPQEHFKDNNELIYSAERDDANNSNKVQRSTAHKRRKREHDDRINKVWKISNQEVHCFYPSWY